MTFRTVKASAALLTETIVTPEGPRQVTQNRFTALRAFELYACTAGADPANPGCAASTSAGWTLVVASEANAFPGDNPRPVQPALILRSWPVEATATHVLFRVVDNQCTGQASFQGEQDNDPENETDCRDTTVDEQVRATELQVLSAKPVVTGASQAE